jgi:hypothetical protein
MKEFEGEQQSQKKQQLRELVFANFNKKKPEKIPEHSAYEEESPSTFDRPFATNNIAFLADHLEFLSDSSPPAKTRMTPI